MGTVRYRMGYCPPSPCSISWDDKTSVYMSIELQTTKVDLHLQDEEKREERLKNIEQENRMPSLQRYYDVDFRL